ncbi:hypothetical protein P171DRAFT_436680 [Karstenula rhodostoma CBS 690.94]|uniref:FAD-binding domain-containing protein n=1 Tax=Karstenula rhodostoma CBS 690.94 TaxID=1392251 RepID=A0A9P4P7I9_9PLEO|nr:hypothetical protein P171DRAFT_436680 [Karstenula rhodostoma CBS 690.94]
MKAYARTIFAPPYLEVLETISSPFVHLITDYCSPRACFFGGKALLVGDAFSLLRPHIAFSTNQAAYQALITESFVKGEIGPELWEYQVTKAAYLHWRRSVWFGDFFQRAFYAPLGSAVCYWVTAALARFRTWVGWLPRQSI